MPKTKQHDLGAAEGPALAESQAAVKATGANKTVAKASSSPKAKKASSTKKVDVDHSTLQEPVPEAPAKAKATAAIVKDVQEDGAVPAKQATAVGKSARAKPDGAVKKPDGAAKKEVPAKKVAGAPKAARPKEEAPAKGAAKGTVAPPVGEAGPQAKAATGSATAPAGGAPSAEAQGADAQVASPPVADAPVAEAPVAGRPLPAQEMAAQGPNHKLAKQPSKTASKASAPKRPSVPAEDDVPQELFYEHQKALLVAERGNYTRQAEELKAQAAALALEHEPGDVQFDEEGGEGGTANVDRELDLHLSAQAQAAIEEIDAALEKIADGTYGYCESCGNPVPKARLEAIPHARLCVTCKSGGLSARRQ